MAEKLGITAVHVSDCPIFLPSPHHIGRHRCRGGRFRRRSPERQELDRLSVENYNAVVREGLNTNRVALGLPPVDNVRDYLLGDRPWLVTDPVLAPWQEAADLDVVQTGAWMLSDERPPPADLEAFLDAGAPPVYVGFGSVPVPEDVARMAVEAARAHGRRVILARGWANLAPIDDRDDCFSVGEVDQQVLFRRVATVVHHGGAGTTTTAARACAPQVVVPRMGDQPYWASRVAELGIGAADDCPTPSTQSLSAALATALAPDTRDRATAVGGRIRTDRATVAGELVLDTVGQGRAPVSAEDAVAVGGHGVERGRSSRGLVRGLRLGERWCVRRCRRGCRTPRRAGQRWCAPGASQQKALDRRSSLVKGWCFIVTSGRPRQDSNLRHLPPEP
ncbi:glycosyltransferase [Prauserella oleivorans]|uniref:Glycosyltransferase n=1 Tax=Prauserella oleivorans TaxID=1478153 RepID=A0ABW5WHR3_9PSEU